MTTQLEVGSGQTYTTITAAEASIPEPIVDGYIVNIHEGTYNEDIVVSSRTMNGNTITFQNNGSDVVVVDGTTNGFDINTADVTIKGLEITSAGDGIDINAGTTTVTECLIHSCNKGIEASNSPHGASHDINKTIFRNNNNGMYTINNGPFGFGTVDHCVFVNNAIGFTVTGVGQGTNWNAIKNSIFFNNVEAIDGTSARKTSLSYCNFYANGTASTGSITLGSGIIYTDPRIVSPLAATFDFHLYTGTPCDNAGDDSKDMGIYPDGPLTALPSADTFYISPTGNDTTGDGSVGNPWATYSKALTNMDYGDTLRVMDGTITEDVTISGGQNIAIEKNPSDSPILNGRFVITNNIGISVSEIEVIGSSGIGIDTDSLLTVIDDCNVHGFGTGIKIDGAFVTVSNSDLDDNAIGLAIDGDNSTITICNVTGASTAGIDVSASDMTVSLCEISGCGKGIDSTGSPNAAGHSVTNCIIRDNTFGVYVAGNNKGAHGTIKNCVFDNNATGYRSLGTGGQGTGWSLIKNSIFFGNTIAARGTNGNATTSLTYSDFYDNDTDISGDTVILGAGVIYIDPLFVDEPNDDYHLKSEHGYYGDGVFLLSSVTSLCIDAGHPSDDYLNEIPMNGDRINMGRYGNTAEASKTDNITFEDSEVKNSSVRKIKFAWTSDASGDVLVITDKAFSGKVERFVTVPWSGDSRPSDNYDVVMNDADGVDVLLDNGANRSNIDTEQVNSSSLGTIANDRITLLISNAGDTKSGVVILHVR